MEEQKGEWLKCKLSSSYFVDNYCWIYDATASSWIPFKLWPEQFQVLEELEQNRLFVILKARQLGLTWLVLCFILWRMIFWPEFTALLFSRREVESIYLLSDQRLRGIYNRLPEWCKVRQILSDASHVWQLSNGSVAYAFPTSAGDSYTASFVFVDEADLVPDLPALMNAVKPTIDGGGQLILLSRADKDKPGSMFKNIYKAARAGLNGWKHVFLPWMVRPDRDQRWYDAQKADIFTRTTSYDDLFQQYPATDDEALMPATINRRIPYEWLKKCYFPENPIPRDEVELATPLTLVWRRPEKHEEYVIGADPAEGNPTSDDSVAQVLNAYTGEQCAVLAGKIEPATFADYLVQLSKWYNGAKILPERNNHGHAVILALGTVYEVTPILGMDEKAGWMSSAKGKALMYDTAVAMLRDGLLIIHDETTLNQLTSIDGATLRAPEGEPDDYATGFSLGAVAITQSGITVEFAPSPVQGYRGR